MNFTKEDHSDSFCGSPEYMSPEMLLNDSQHNHMIDYYALGCLLYEMIVGIPPFYSTDRQTMYSNIVYQQDLNFPQDLCQDACSLIQKLLHKNPENRLGANGGVAEIKAHEFCSDIQWDKLIMKKITPPYKPNHRECNFDAGQVENEIFMDLLKVSQENVQEGKSLKDDLTEKNKKPKRRLSDQGLMSGRLS